MPDITMCTNELCLKRRECYRFVAKPSRAQSYATYGIAAPCESFLKIPQGAPVVTEKASAPKRSSARAAQRSAKLQQQ